MFILLFVMVGIFLAFPILFFIWMHSVKLEKKEADAIIVLGYKCEENRIHPLLEERLDTAIDLFKNNLYHYIILTGGAVASKNSEAEIMFDYLIQHSIPEKNILLETASQNTVFNVINCKGIMNDYKLNTCLVVSNSFHIRRIRYITNALNIPASFYAKRNINTISKQSKMTFKEILAFRATLPWLEKTKNMNNRKSSNL
ncbi:YdcF family protein [Neobacillus niacini]|uniref:YdcF family protein n=1 Tax=Neobacillus niacini TaxID=86668 RepID=UPI002FFE3AF6